MTSLCKSSSTQDINDYAPLLINAYPVPRTAYFKIVTTCSKTNSVLDVYGINADLRVLLERHYKASLDELTCQDDPILENFSEFCNHHNIYVADNIDSTYLQKRTKTDDLSYPVHTHRELRLMLNEGKPLSVFSRHINEEISLQDLTGGQVFTGNGFVENIWSYNDSVYHFYALKSQAWRIEAYKTMIKSMVNVGHSRQLEWIEGFLLGYTPEQNKEFLSKFYPAV